MMHVFDALRLCCKTGPLRPAREASFRSIQQRLHDATSACADRCRREGLGPDTVPVLQADVSMVTTREAADKL